MDKDVVSVQIKIENCTSLSKLGRFLIDIENLCNFANTINEGEQIQNLKDELMGNYDKYFVNIQSRRNNNPVNFLSPQLDPYIFTITTTVLSSIIFKVLEKVYNHIKETIKTKNDKPGINVEISTNKPSINKSFNNTYNIKVSGKGNITNIILSFKNEGFMDKSNILDSPEALNIVASSIEKIAESMNDENKADVKEEKKLLKGEKL